METKKGDRIMMIRLIHASSRSLTFECMNQEIFYAAVPYAVYCDDVLVKDHVRTNVFSLFSLSPDTTYSIRVDEDVLEARTLQESMSLDVRDFGARGDGVSDDTFAIQAAINAVKPGGRVLLSGGTFYSYPLFLKSDMTLEIDRSAVLLGGTDRTFYPILPVSVIDRSGQELELSSWEGEPHPTFASLLTGLQVHHVHVIGEGTIDENAQNSDWWINHKVMRGGAYRPKGVYFSRCQEMHVVGLTIKNTPSWNLHPFFCEKVNFLDLYLESPKDSPNTDGCNPESCSDVSIIGVRFSVGDDCIAIKSGKYEMGMKHRRPSERITIRNCHMAYGHGAVVLGSEMSGGIRDLEVRQCVFAHTDRGLRIKTRRGRGESAIIDGINFENIRMDHVLTPLVINMFYYCDVDGKTEYVWSKSKLPIDEKTPYLGKFTFKNMVCTNVHVAAGFFYGLPEQPIRSIALENIQFTYAEDAISDVPAMMSDLDPMQYAGLIFKEVETIKLVNVHLEGYHGEEVVTEHVQKIIRE
jgi:polygalacturonase